MAVTYYVALPFIRTDDGPRRAKHRSAKAKLQIEQAEGMLSDPANAEAVAFYERSQDRETARAAGALAIGSEPNTILAPILLPQREIQTNFSSKHLAFLGFREGRDCQRERLRE
jgi:hypothetical protein